MKSLKPRRSKEEIAEIEAEAARKRAARVAKMQGACGFKVGLPCPHGCSVGCQRLKLQRNASKARLARSKKARDALAASVETRQAHRQKEERDRLAAIRFTEKRRKSANAALEQWQVAVLYLVGWSTDEIVKRIHGGDSRRGPVNRIITRCQLVAARAAPDRLAKLIELDKKSPHGFAGYVDSHAAHGPQKGLYADLVRIRGIEPVLVVKHEHTRTGERIWNTGSSALQVAARAGAIQEWNVQAGLHLHGLFWQISGGGIGSLDYSKDIVDGSSGSGEGAFLQRMSAVERMEGARKAVKEAFEIEGTAAWRWAVIDHVVLLDKPLKDFDLPEGMTVSPALFLNDALEPIAILLKTAPAGVALRQPSREDWARHELAKGIRAHREARMESGS